MNTRLDTCARARIPNLAKSSGFTLVELMVVVLVIGILVAIAVPVFLSVKSQSEKASCQANQRMWAGVVQTAKADGREPAWGSPSGEILTTWSVWGSVAVGRYVQKVPRCPAALATYEPYYCTQVGPIGYQYNGRLYADQWKTGSAVWSTDHALGIW